MIKYNKDLRAYKCISGEVKWAAGLLAVGTLIWQDKQYVFEQGWILGQENKMSHLGPGLSKV